MFQVVLLSMPPFDPLLHYSPGLRLPSSFLFPPPPPPPPPPLRHPLQAFEQRNNTHEHTRPCVGCVFCPLRDIFGKFALSSAAAAARAPSAGGAAGAALPDKLDTIVDGQLLRKALAGLFAHGGLSGAAAAAAEKARFQQGETADAMESDSESLLLALHGSLSHSATAASGPVSAPCRPRRRLPPATTAVRTSYSACPVHAIFGLYREEAFSCPICSHMMHRFTWVDLLARVSPLAGAGGAW